jgi:hypothetical protein
MLLEVEDAIRVSQDNEDAVAFGLAAARILGAQSSACALAHRIIISLVAPAFTA